MPSSCPDEVALHEFARGGLVAVERDALEQHIDVCEPCARIVAELLRVFGSLDPLASPSNEPGVGIDSGEPTLLSGGAGGPTGVPASPSLLAEGAKLGRYVVLRRVGAGAMGVVYAAYDPELDRKVAVKLLHADETAEQSDVSRSQRNRRLLREAQAMARLHHPNVVTVHDVGTLEGQVFLAMEFVDGGTLRQWMVARRRSWREVLDVFRAAGKGLDAAHAVGLAHRDFKPDNVLLGSDGRVVVTDLGLARTAGSQPDEPLGLARTADSSPSALVETLTRTGALVGTPAYMSPEQLQGKRADALSDQFSFCVALYEGVYGVRPFAGGSLGALVASVLDGRVRPPGDARVPRWLRRAILRGLCVDPSRRFPDMPALLSALRPPSRALQLGLGAAVLGVGGLVTTLALSSQSQLAYCERAPEHLVGVWDRDIASAVEQAFDGTELSFAAGTAATSIERVDAYAARWIELQVETCRREHTAQEAAGVVALRMACLATRKEALATLGSLLREADATTVVRAPDMIDALPSLATCEDTGALSEGPPPPSAEHVAEVDAIRGRLARAMVLSTAGKVQEATEHAEDALDRAEAIDYGPVRAEALLQAARSREEAGELQTAEARAHEALTVGLATRHPRLVAEASHQLAHLAIVREVVGPDAERWVALGRAALEQLSGGAPLVEAQLLSALGTAQRQRGELEVSAGTLQAAVTVLEEQLGEDDFRLASALSSLGLTLARLGRHDDARQRLERARDLFARKYGRDHLTYASTLQNLGAAYYMQGAYGHALELYRESLAGLEAALGPDHVNVGLLAYSVSTASLMLGRYDEALDLARRAQAIGASAHGDRSVPAASNWSLIGEIHLRAGRLDEARDALRRALSDLEAADPNERRRHAFYRSQLGATLVELGELEEAERVLTAALEEQEALLGERDEYVAETLGRLAELRLRGDDAGAAVTLAERSLSVYDVVPAPPQARAEARFRLARTLAAAEPSERGASRARTLAEEARDMLLPLERDPAALEAVEAWLREHPSTGARAAP